MCRLVVYKGRCDKPLLLADLIIYPEHSIIKQSFACRERRETTMLPGELNADGFGVGWYSATDESSPPCVMTSIQPAWSNRNLHRISAAIRSHLIFAHVRAAPPGSVVNDSNCHPFTHDRYLFMHNGHIGGFKDIKRKLLASLSDKAFHAIEGSTDSEHAFAVFIDKTIDYPNDLIAAFKATLLALHELSQHSNTYSYLNFVVSDGDTVLASRIVDDHRDPTSSSSTLDPVQGASLYFSSGTEFKSYGEGVYKMASYDRREEVVIIASERLTTVEEDWVKVPDDTILHISPNDNVLLHSYRVRDHCPCHGIPKPIELNVV